MELTALDYDGCEFGFLGERMDCKPGQLLDDFLAAARRGGINISQNAIGFEILPMPHNPPSRLPKGKVAVYIFSDKERVLKVGQVGPNSQSRYTSHHYNPDSSGSNLSKSLLEDEHARKKYGLTQETVGEWVKKNTDRVNFIIDADCYGPVLNLFEAFVQCRLNPLYEGRASRRKTDRRGTK